jgi:hypothetical protein
MAVKFMNKGKTSLFKVDKKPKERFGLSLSSTKKNNTIKANKNKPSNLNIAK